MRLSSQDSHIGHGPSRCVERTASSWRLSKQRRQEAAILQPQPQPHQPVDGVVLLLRLVKMVFEAIQ